MMQQKAVATEITEEKQEDTTNGKSPLPPFLKGGF